MFYLHLLIGFMSIEKQGNAVKKLVPVLKVITVTFSLHKILTKISTKEERLNFPKT